MEHLGISESLHYFTQRRDFCHSFLFLPPWGYGTDMSNSPCDPVPLWKAVVLPSLPHPASGWEALENLRSLPHTSVAEPRHQKTVDQVPAHSPFLACCPGPKLGTYFWVLLALWQPCKSEEEDRKEHLEYRIIITDSVITLENLGLKNAPSRFLSVTGSWVSCPIYLPRPPSESSVDSSSWGVISLLGISTSKPLFHHLSLIACAWKFQTSVEGLLWVKLLFLGERNSLSDTLYKYQN